jgi:predicted RNA binding protein YcfA (HicA-like mRNA interferase family)
MSYKPIKTKCWENFLAYQGFKYNRTNGSHDIWTKSGKRSIPVWGNEKEIPAMHISNSCRTIGCTIDIFEAWASNNC